MTNPLINRIIIVAVILIAISSCYSKKEVVEINAYNCKAKKYEIQIKTNTTGRGNIHNPFSFSKYELNDNEWIYTNSINGKLPADSMIFTYVQRRIKFPWSYTNLKGFVSFESDSIELNLFFYDRENIKAKDSPYEFNGKYKLNVINDTIPIIEDFWQKKRHEDKIGLRVYAEKLIKAKKIGGI